ncbi:MAG: lipocalin-like domain-containing protein [Clostridiales bacterium]|jgi:hypothetical protein|nr:lipocalin-like domain-containing protein [Clostridiales bacterium]
MDVLKAKLYGTWSIVSYESRIGQDVSYPFGKDVVGQLKYGPDGKMSAQLMQSGRSKVSSVDVYVGSEKELTAIGYLAYFGTFDVDEEKGIVTHYVEGALFPRWVDTKLTRLYDLKANRLTLTTPPIQTKGEQIISVLVWEKISA